MLYSSKSRISLVIAVFALVSFAFLIAGCGDEDEPAGAGSTAAATSENGGSGEESATAETGSTDASAEDGGASPGGDEGDEGGAGDEEPARAPIDITVIDGKFGGKTSDEVHVPTYMAIELNVDVKDEKDAKLQIERPGKKFARTFPAGKKTSYLMDGLQPGKAMVVSYGGDSVVVIADLVAGP